MLQSNARLTYNAEGMDNKFTKKGKLNPYYTGTPSVPPAGQSGVTLGHGWDFGYDFIASLSWFPTR